MVDKIICVDEWAVATAIGANEGAKVNTFFLSPGVKIVKVLGRLQALAGTSGAGGSVVERIEFKTNKGWSYGPYGANHTAAEGEEFEHTAPEGKQLVGLVGSTVLWELWPVVGGDLQAIWG
jgi:hypothetical protein